MQLQKSVLSPIICNVQRSGWSDASELHLAGRLALVEVCVRRLLEQRGGADAVDPLGSLVITHDEVERLLADGSDRFVALLQQQQQDADLAAAARRLEAEGASAEAAGTDVRLLALRRRFSLFPLDVDLLCVALAPELDSRFARLFAYLQDDFSARRATVGLALELVGCSALDGSARARLQPGAPLADSGLVSLPASDVPWLQRPLVVPERVVRHLLGDDALDPAVERLVLRPLPDLVDGAAQLGAAVGGPSPLVYLREPAEGVGVGHAVAAFEALSMPSLAVDLAAEVTSGNERIVGATILDARLLDAGLIVTHAEQLAAVPGVMDRLCRSAVPIVLVGGVPWDPAWSAAVPLCLDLPLPSVDALRGLWGHALRAAGAEVGDEGYGGLPGFDLSPVQVVRTAEQAAQRASHAGRDLTEADLREAARHQNGSAMLSLARRVAPSARWDDLVVPAPVADQLHELLDRVRFAPQVLERWDMRSSTRRGSGVKALFCGPPGTGKTLAAEVIAGALGLDLFVIDLSSVVDKYIGETEKHLERMFRAASEMNGVLLFDEADALFGKRSEVREAKDRYANIETSYLLQRLDVFEGFVILATNVRSNLDEAFTRRLDLVVEMGMPGPAERGALWDRCLGRLLPRDADVDLAFCAKAFELSGGSIRNIALTAGFFAAAGDGCLHMEDLIWAVQREYRKMGRLCSQSEFGPWWDLVAGEAPVSAPEPNPAGGARGTKSGAHVRVR